MADLSIELSVSTEIDGTTYSLESTMAYTMTAPEKAFSEIVTTSTTATDISVGSGMSWAGNTVKLLVLANLSTTVGENIDILHNAQIIATILPGMAMHIFPKADGVSYQWDAATGTPRLQVIALGAFA